jgi:transposase
MIWNCGASCAAIIAAFDAMGGASREILYDRMKTAVIGEEPDGRASTTIARSPIWTAITAFMPRVRRPHRAKTKDKVDRQFWYFRENFFLGCSFRDLDDPNGQLRYSLETVANPGVHAQPARSQHKSTAGRPPF